MALTPEVKWRPACEALPVAVIWKAPEPFLDRTREPLGIAGSKARARLWYLAASLRRRSDFFVRNDEDFPTDVIGPWRGLKGFEGFEHNDESTLHVGYTGALEVVIV